MCRCVCGFVSLVLVCGAVRVAAEGDQPLEIPAIPPDLSFILTPEPPDRVHTGASGSAASTDVLIEAFGPESVSLRPLIQQLIGLETDSPLKPPVPPSFARQIKEKLQSSAQTHDCRYKRRDCDGKIAYILEDLSELVELVGCMRIAEASPELVAHLPTPSMMLIPTDVQSPAAIRATARLGPGTVPLVLEKMRSELQYEDEGTRAYWDAAMSFFDELYRSGAVFKVQRLIEQEKDPKMRSELEKRILGPLGPLTQDRKRQEDLRSRVRGRRR